MNSEAKSNLGRAVKWKDENDGWHTGRVVLFEGVEHVVNKYLPSHFGLSPLTVQLVRESYTSQLVWVPKYILQSYKMRSEWTKEEKEMCGEVVSTD